MFQRDNLIYSFNLRGLKLGFQSLRRVNNSVPPPLDVYATSFDHKDMTLFTDYWNWQWILPGWILGYWYCWHVAWKTQVNNSYLSHRILDSFLCILKWKKKIKLKPVLLAFKSWSPGLAKLVLILRFFIFIFVNIDFFSMAENQFLTSEY